MGPTSKPTAKTPTSVAVLLLSVLPREVPAVLLTPLARASTLTKAPRRLPSTRRLWLPTTPRPPTSVPPWAPTGLSTEKPRPLNMLALTLRNLNTSPCEVMRNGLILPKSNGARCSDHHLEIGVDHQ